MKHFGDAVMVWSAIPWFSVSPMITLQGHITAKNYVNILTDQIHLMAKTLLPNGNGVFQDDSSHVHTAHIV